MTPAFQRIPVSYFGVVLGLVGLGDCWRAATELWSVPRMVSVVIMDVAVIVWVLLALAYATKWIAARASALAEIHHPFTSSFVSLLFIATLLIAYLAVSAAGGGGLVTGE